MELARGVARRVRRLLRGNALEVPASVMALDGGMASVESLDYRRHPIKLLVTSEMEKKWRTRACKKEPWTVAWLEESLANGGVLYDVGANIGAFSLIAAKVCGSRGRVVAFEPGFASYARLCSNIVLNGCQSIIVPVPLALGNATGLLSFAYRSLDPGQSRHDFQPAQWSPEAAAAGRYVQPMLSMKLDEAVRTFALPPPDHLKIDVDGAELAVLDGAAQTLGSESLKTVLIEIDRRSSEAAIALLARSGFSLDRRHERARGEKAETDVWYGIFRRAQPTLS